MLLNEAVKWKPLKKIINQMWIIHARPQLLLALHWHLRQKWNIAAPGAGMKRHHLPQRALSQTREAHVGRAVGSPYLASCRGSTLSSHRACMKMWQTFKGWWGKNSKDWNTAKLYLSIYLYVWYNLKAAKSHLLSPLLQIQLFRSFSFLFFSNI